MIHVHVEAARSIRSVAVKHKILTIKAPGWVLFISLYGIIPKEK